MHLITGTLILGNIDDARDPMPAIAGLLLVAEEFTIEPPPWLDYLHVPFKEFSAVDPARLDRAVTWLEARARGARTLVCCRAGMGRSASILIAYFCCTQGMSYEESVAFVKARRPGAMPLPKLRETIEKVLKLRAHRINKKAQSASAPRVA
jgi:protein-tyrosine phosphatase